MREVNTFVGEKCIVLNVKTNCLYPACAIISKIRDNKWYFDRLMVPKEARHQGFASRLMERLVSLLDEKDIELINEVHGRGDLNNDQLVVFYKKYGFQETERPYRLLRLPH